MVTRLYGLFAGIALVAVLIATIFYYRLQYNNAYSEVQNVTRMYNDAVATNKRQQETIKNLTEMRIVVDNINNKLANELEEINNNITEQTRQLGQLKEISEDAKQFLSLPIPSDIKRLRGQ